MKAENKTATQAKITVKPADLRAARHKAPRGKLNGRGA